MNPRIIVMMILGMSISGLRAQTTLEQCQTAARENYPLTAQRGLIEQSLGYNLKNANIANYPQLGLSAKATIQTDVTSVPLPMIPPMSREQYQVAVDVSQSIWDGGVTSSNKRTIKASAEVDKRRLEVDLYTLNDRVNNLFFGILMLEEQLALNTLLDEELARNMTTVESYIASGIANSADLDAVKLEVINNRQQRITMNTAREAYLTMLSAMVGFDIEQLVKPEIPNISPNTIARPELDLFDAQVAQIETQRKTIKARNMPKFGGFVQGAYGSPGLDMLKPGATFYAIGGVRMSWNLSGFYGQRTDMAKILNQQNTIETQRQAFIYNLNLQLTQNDSEIQRLRKQMVQDEQIIALRGNIKRAAEARVAGGTMSVSDMLREVTAENSALQNRQLHQIELLMNLYTRRTMIND